MDPKYELLCRYAPGVDPTAVVSSLLSEWQQSGRPPLLVFPKRGAGVEPSCTFLQERLAFSPDREDVLLRLRTGKEKDADVVDFYFTNPTWSYSRPANYCSSQFRHDKIDHGDTGYSAAALVRLLSALVVSGPAKSAYVEEYSALHLPEMESIERQLAADVKASQWPSPLHWITYLPSNAWERLRDRIGAEELGIREVGSLNARGVIIAVGGGPPVERGRHHARLLATMRAMGLTN